MRITTKSDVEEDVPGCFLKGEGGFKNSYFIRGESQRLFEVCVNKISV